VKLIEDRLEVRAATGGQNHNAVGAHARILPHPRSGEVSD
jgi:hypothetical protein